MKTILRIMKIILRIVGFETGYAERSRKSQRKGQEKCVYMNQCQDKTNPSLVTGLRCKPYTRNPFDYRRLCELVLGWRVLRGNKCVTRARGNIFQPFPRRGQRCIYMNVCARRAQRPTNLFDRAMPSRRQRCMNMNVCARRAQKPSLLGFCRAAAKHLLQTNEFTEFFCPRISLIYTNNKAFR